ncbi:MAG: hypothetical protein ACLTQP_04080 [Faecalibacterium prausnitzii]
MKLFKKLAAAVLVAALALMMVGCGSKTGLAQQIKDAVSDDAVLRNEQATNSKDLDALAAKLLTEIDKALAELEEDEWPDPNELLNDEEFLKKVGIDPATEAYALSLTRNPSYLSNTMNQAKPFEIAGDLVYRLMQGDLKIGKPKLGSKFEFGLAIGTLDGKNCVLMIAK